MTTLVIVVLRSVAATCVVKNKATMLFINLPDLEAAINYWRTQSPSKGDALELCPEVSALAKPYAALILQGSKRLSID